MNPFTFIAHDPDYPSQRAVDFILANYWVYWSNDKLHWVFGRDSSRCGGRARRRPTLDEIIDARWRGERLSRSYFRVRPNRSGGADVNCPVSNARQAARDYLDRKQGTRKVPTP